MEKPILEMRGIGKRFPGVVALDAVDFSISAGEIVALAGENGAGKSTLMKVLGGVYQPEDGEIFIEGEKAPIRGVADATRFGIGFVHQELNVLDNMTVAENVFLGREPRRFGFLVNENKLNADTEIYLKRLRLGLSSRMSLNRLSIAEQQMVEIAKALSMNAQILIMDEPTSSLTLIETETLLSLIKDLSAQGVSVIYISHRLGEISEIADRVVVLRDGRNAGELPRERISHDAIIKLMVGRAIEHREKPERMGGTTDLVEVSGLKTHRYPDESISFSVRKGEILGFAGLVGAGRSDAAQAIFGVDESLEGKIKLDGNEIEISSARDAIRNGIYLVPEDRRNCGLILEDSIRANITLPALHRYSSAGIIKKSAETVISKKMCESLGVKAPSVEAEAGNLSGGNQQKVVLAKWLSLGPKMIIFDEPTRGIDVGAKAEIYRLMRSLADNGVAVVMISSDMEEILGESDRIAVMSEGAITGFLDGSEASEESVMQLAVGRAKERKSIELRTE